MTTVGRTAKRVLDLVASSLAFVVLACPFAAIAVAIRLDGKGPVFFRQERVGKGGRVFRVWKFRTMTETRISPEGPDFLYRDDPRITRVGRFLRNLGLDELPQLLNVLSGEMTLVGPRPTLAYQVERYSPFQKRRLEVRPGITSLAVVSGRNALSWNERIELDIWYIDHWSLGLDVKIMLHTLWKVLVTREGLYGQDGANDMFVDTEPRRGTKNDEGDEA